MLLGKSFRFLLLIEVRGALVYEVGRMKSCYVRKTGKEKQEELEDYYLAMESLEKTATGKLRVWSHEEIECGRDLED